MDGSKVYLVQTDTTVGFLSNDPSKLSKIKKRDLKQKILQAVDGFKTLQKNVRVPNRFKKRIRNATKTTFIYPDGNSYRVVDKDDNHQNFLKKLQSAYSTSANITKQEFNEDFAIDQADIILFSKEGFVNKSSSSIFIINGTKIKRIR